MGYTLDPDERDTGGRGEEVSLGPAADEEGPRRQARTVRVQRRRVNTRRTTSGWPSADASAVLRSAACSVQAARSKASPQHHKGQTRDALWSSQAVEVGGGLPSCGCCACCVHQCQHVLLA